MRRKGGKGGKGGGYMYTTTSQQPLLAKAYPGVQRGTGGSSSTRRRDKSLPVLLLLWCLAISAGCFALGVSAGLLGLGISPWTMPLISKTIVIPQPVEDVWNFVANFENQAKWYFTILTHTHSLSRCVCLFDSKRVHVHVSSYTEILLVVVLLLLLLLTVLTVLTVLNPPLYHDVQGPGMYKEHETRHRPDGRGHGI